MPCAGLLPLQWAANTMRAWLGTGHAMDCVKGLRPLGACPERSPVIAPGEQAATLPNMFWAIVLIALKFEAPAGASAGQAVAFDSGACTDFSKALSLSGAGRCAPVHLCVSVCV